MVELLARVHKELKIRTMKLRVLLSFIQVCIRLQVAFRLRFPPLVISFLSFLSFFDIGRFVKLVASSKCLIQASAVTQLYAQCYGTLVLLVAFKVAASVNPEGGYFDGLLVFSFLVYPSVTSSLLLTFDCKEFENSKIYMIGDPSILCTDPDYNSPALRLRIPCSGCSWLGYLWHISVFSQSSGGA